MKYTLLFLGIYLSVSAGLILSYEAGRGFAPFTGHNEGIGSLEIALVAGGILCFFGCALIFAFEDQRKDIDRMVKDRLEKCRESMEAQSQYEKKKEESE